ncbi:MAG: sulfatase-like hydrolase/transferase [Actinobacteria bacterium]|uniref:Unannotated protein n=1 Tax=freshwater metagenome TaxID=449393 RepID=A0A6J7AUM3_9ZZZZ|nr:sulfatase-like hydrolase/transferase [Actinomycetota bacterium]MSX88661.1 sulfatase-like hydrolase/transferase [Actinomycetota bacterium]MSY73421.1 sulfatase-like hydrolase/transferase [Actinomycetota bacterium]
MLTYDEREPFPGTVGRELADSVQAYPEVVKPSAGTPNVLLVVLDDVGYAQIGCFGSDVETPTFDRLAANGLRYRSFHTTAMCSPTRACLLTGRNQHTTGMGGISDNATGFPGFDGRIDKATGFLSEVLRDEGFATMAIGKWHLAPREESDLAASRKRWPLGRGFERYYGFLGAETNQYAPDLVHDNHFVEPPKSEADGYHLTEDLADRAIEFLNDLRNVTTDKPFFMYLAPGACHAPHQAPREFIDRYAGRFDKGWDSWRAETHQRQLDLGILPPGTQLTDRPEWIQEWASLPEVERRVYARMMEVYAGFLTHTDFHVGRVIDHLDTLGDLDNTIVVVLSDNGASPEGGRHGAFNSVAWYNGVPLTLEAVLPKVDLLGSQQSHGHYPYGWAHAGNTPFQRWKRECHEGGVADPLIVHWPAGTEARGEVRSQYLHAVDIMPTLLDALGVAMPSTIDGVSQVPIEGMSLLESFTDPATDRQRVTQYYELLGCRALYHDGWKAVAYHPMRGQLYVPGLDPDAPFADDRWELYRVADDFSESNDLADVEPARTREMIERWWAEAGRHGALPLHSSRPVLVERPAHYEPRSRYVYRPGSAVASPAAVDVRHRPSVTIADVEIAANDEGVLLAHGGRFGGYSLYVKDGCLHYVHNVLGQQRHRVSSPTLPLGPHRLGYTYTPTQNYAGTVDLIVDGDMVASGDIPQTTIYAYHLFGEYLCIGFDDGTPVDDTYVSPFHFTGLIRTIVVDVSGEKHRDVQVELEAFFATQ